MSDDQAQLVQEEARAAFRARVQIVADDLIGTAQSLYQVATQQEIDDPAFEIELRELAFTCDQCGWWASTEELHNDPQSGQSMDEMCEECFDGDGGIDE